MDRFTQLEVFIKTAELGSLSKAAEHLGMSTSAASRHLTALEERLGGRLIVRNTRRLWLTEAGQEFFRNSTALLGELNEAEDAVAARTSSPKGVLRVTSSLSFAMKFLAPMLSDFYARYRDIKIQIIAENRYSDFIEAGIDIAIRTREHEPDSNIVIRQIGRMRRLLAASPGYLSGHSSIIRPEDLSDHDVLVYSLSNNPHLLRLKKGPEERNIRLQPLLESNDGQILRRAAVDGLGILIQPHYIIAEELRGGDLVEVLPDWELPPLTMNLAYQNRARLPAKISVFRDFLIEYIRQQPEQLGWQTRG